MRSNAHNFVMTDFPSEKAHVQKSYRFSGKVKYGVYASSEVHAQRLIDEFMAKKIPRCITYWHKNMVLHHLSKGSGTGRNYFLVGDVTYGLKAKNRKEANEMLIEAFEEADSEVVSGVRVVHAEMQLAELKPVIL